MLRLTGKDSSRVVHQCTSGPVTVNDVLPVSIIQSRGSAQAIRVMHQYRRLARQHIVRVEDVLSELGFRRSAVKCQSVAVCWRALMSAPVAVSVAVDGSGAAE
jgi:hypothetical protein